MVHAKRKGYRNERKIRMLFEKNGWKVVRAGASLGEADLICVKDGKCIMLQIKSCNRKCFYYYEYLEPTLQGFPYYLVVDFGYGKIRVLPPQKRVDVTDGIGLLEFLQTL